MVVIVGALTRLASALLARPELRQGDKLLVARDGRDADRLSSRYPATAGFRIWQAGQRFPLAPKTVTVVCCAIGLAHPARPRFPEDHRSLELECEALRQIVLACRDSDLRMLLVSSVIAMAPPRRRAYYGGQRSVAEGISAALLRTHPRAGLSVIFAGRLAESRSGPLSLWSTSYADLARIMAVDLERGRPVDRIVGLDARLWLLKRSAILALKAALRSTRSIDLDQRDPPPTVGP